jgi:hypothetical protein
VQEPDESGWMVFLKAAETLDHAACIAVEESVLTTQRSAGWVSTGLISNIGVPSNASSG